MISMDHREGEANITYMYVKLILKVFEIKHNIPENENRQKHRWLLLIFLLKLPSTGMSFKTAIISNIS